MKKYGVFLAVFPVILALVACEIPKAIEVRAAPDISIDAEVDLSKEIKSKIREAMKEKLDTDFEPGIAFARKIVSDDEENMVLVARLKVFELNKSGLFDALIGLTYNSTIGSTTIKQALTAAGQTVLLSNLPNILSSTNSVVTTILNQTISKQAFPSGAIPDIPEVEIGSMGDILTGFTFKETPGELYICDESANSIVGNYLEYACSFNGGEKIQGSFNKTPQDYEDWDWSDTNENEFTYGGPPDSDCVKIPALFKDNKLDAEFTVSLKQNATVRNLLECLNNSNGIKAEIIARIPLVFLAKDDNAYFLFPAEDVLGDKDLFQRPEPGEDQDFKMELKKMNIQIKFLNKAAVFNKMFKGKKLVIANSKNPDGFSRPSAFNTEFFELDFNEKEMKEINTLPVNNPFVPEMKIYFDPAKNDTLTIPWDLDKANIRLNAKLAVIVMDLR